MGIFTKVKSSLKNKHFISTIISEKSKIKKFNMSTKGGSIEEREEGEIVDEFEDIISSDEEFSMRKRIEELEAKNAELEKIANISVSAVYANGGYNDYPKKDSYHLDRYPLVSIDLSDDEDIPPTPRISKRRKSVQHSSLRHKLLHTSGSSNHRYRKRSSSPPPPPQYRQSDKLLLSMFHERVAAQNSHSSRRKRKTKKSHSNKSSRRKSREYYITDPSDEYNLDNYNNHDVDDNPPNHFNTSDCDNSFVLNRDELQVALARNTLRIEQPASLKDRLTRKKENTDIFNYVHTIEDSPSPKREAVAVADAEAEVDVVIVPEEIEKKEIQIERPPEEQKVESDDDDLEEQELRILALKSAMLKKHMVRKKRNENLAYSPSDFDEIYKCISESPSLNHIDEQETCNSMEISPAPSPKMVLSDEGGGIDTKPVDMDIANSDSECELPSYDKWIPIEQIPLPNGIDQTMNDEIYNPTPMRYNNIAINNIFTNNNNAILNENLLMPPGVQYESSSVSPKNFDSEVDEEESALRALLLSKMNSPKVSKIAKEPPPKMMKTHTPDPDVSLEAEVLRNFLIDNMKKRSKPNNSSASVLKEAVRRLTNRNVSTSSKETEAINRTTAEDDQIEDSNATSGTTSKSQYIQQQSDLEDRIREEKDSEESEDANNQMDVEPPETQKESLPVLETETNCVDVESVQNETQNGSSELTSIECIQTDYSFASNLKLVDEKTSPNQNEVLENDEGHASKSPKPSFNQNPNDMSSVQSLENLSKVPNQNECKVEKEFTKMAVEDENSTNILQVQNKVESEEKPSDIKSNSVTKTSDQIEEEFSDQNNDLKSVSKDDCGQVVPPNQSSFVSLFVPSPKSNETELKSTKTISTDDINTLNKVKMYATSETTIEFEKTAILPKKNILPGPTKKSTTTDSTPKSSQTLPKAPLNSTNRQVKLRTKSIEVQIKQNTVVQSSKPPNQNLSISIASNAQKNTEKPSIPLVPHKTTLPPASSVLTQKPIAKLSTAIPSRTKIVKPNKVINQPVIDLKRKIIDNPQQLIQSVPIKKSKIDDNRFITTADIPQVPELIIQLRASDSESDYSDLTPDDMDEDEDTRIGNYFNKSITIGNEYYDIASPISLPMESPCETPIQSGSPAVSRTQTPQPQLPSLPVEKSIVNNYFEAKLEQFLKTVRSKVSENRSSNLKSSTVNSTPVAVRHLPEASQQEYRRLIDRMKMLERQKQAKNLQVPVTTPNAAVEQTKATITEGNGKFLARKVLMKNATTKTPLPSKTIVQKSSTSTKTVKISPQKQNNNSPDSKSKENLLALYENSYRKTGASIICSLDKNLELVTTAKKAKMAKLKHEHRLLELRKQIEEVQTNLKVQQEILTKVYPEICNTHRTIESLKTRRTKINKAVTALGKNVIGPNYSMKNDQKSIISEKSRKLADAIKFVNTMKLSDVESVESNQASCLQQSKQPKQPKQPNVNNSLLRKEEEEEKKIPAIVGAPPQNDKLLSPEEATSKASPSPSPSLLTPKVENILPKCDIQSPPSSSSSLLNKPVSDQNVPEDDVEMEEAPRIKTEAHEEALELKQQNVVVVAAAASVADNDNNIEQAPEQKIIMNDESIDEENGELVGSAKLQDYVSPLGHLRDERHINPNGVVCPYQLMGQCDDKDCKYMHLED